MQQAISVTWLALAAGLQVTVAPHVKLLSGLPNLVLVSVLAWALIRGPMAGLRWAIVGGLLLDVVGQEPFGVHTFALVVVAYFAGFGERALFRANQPFAMLVVAAATLLYYLVVLLLMGALGYPVSFSHGLVQVAVPSSVLNALLTPLAALALNWMDRRFPLPVQPTW